MIIPSWKLLCSPFKIFKFQIIKLKHLDKLEVSDLT